MIVMQRLQLLLTLVSGLEQICFDLELVSYLNVLLLTAYIRVVNEMYDAETETLK